MFKLGLLKVVWYCDALRCIILYSIQ